MPRQVHRNAALGILGFLIKSLLSSLPRPAGVVDPLLLFWFPFT